MLGLNNTTPVQHVEFTTFNEVDMTPRQPEGVDTANKRVVDSATTVGFESEIPREEAHTVKLNKEKKVVVTGDSLLNGISKNGLSRNHQVTVKSFPGRTSENFLEEMENFVVDKPDCIIIHVGRNDINNVINSLKAHSQAHSLATGSPLKMIKNAFYFTSKALFVLKIFKFLS